MDMAHERHRGLREVTKEQDVLVLLCRNFEYSGEMQLRGRGGRNSENNLSYEAWHKMWRWWLLYNAQWSGVYSSTQFAAQMNWTRGLHLNIEIHLL